MVPVVDVLMAVYNHERYLARAIEGIVTQKTNFKFRLIIGEDKSPDKSREIVERYAQKYPDIILPLLHEKNLGASLNSKQLFNEVKAKYIALCDGDDFWTDEYKLQQQVDFMEANPDFAMCFTKVNVIDEQEAPIPNCFPYPPKDELTIEDMIMARSAYVPVTSLLFKNVLPNPMPDFYLNTTFGDTAIFMLITNVGKAKFLDITTATYRKHGGGVTKSEDFAANEFLILYRLYEGANEHLAHKYDKTFRVRLLQVAKTILVYGGRGKHGMKKAKHFFDNFPKYLKYSDPIDVKEAAYYIAMFFFPFILRAKTKSK